MSKTWAFHRGRVETKMDMLVGNVPDSLHAAFMAMRNARRTSDGVWMDAEQKPLDVAAALGMPMDVFVEWHVNFLGLFTAIVKRTMPFEVKGKSQFQVIVQNQKTEIHIRWVQTNECMLGFVKFPELWPQTTIVLRASKHELPPVDHSCVLHFELDFLE